MTTIHAPLDIGSPARVRCHRRRVRRDRKRERDDRRRGRFEIRNLAIGGATITTSAAGYEARSENISLSTGTDAHDVVLVPTPTAILSGVVTPTTGAVVEGASVSVGSATATTGADGRFELVDLPVGSATVVITAPLFDPRSDDVMLVAGSNTHDVALTPQRTASVSGFVRDSTGAVVASAIVLTATSSATTGADGRYELDDLPVGSTTIATSAPRFDTRIVVSKVNTGINAPSVGGDGTSSH